MTKKFFLALVAALLTLGGNIKADVIEEDWDITNNEMIKVSNYCTISVLNGDNTRQVGGKEDGQIRVYTNNILKIVTSDGLKLKSLKFGYAREAVWTCVDNNGTYDESTKTWTGETEVLELKAPSQIRFNSVHAVYEGTSSVVAISKPTFSVIGLSPTADRTIADLHEAPMKLELTSTQEVSIYYTLDGTEPTIESLLYEEPIMLNQTAIVKAFATDGNGNQSDVATNKYYIHKNDANAFYYESFDKALGWGANDDDWDVASYFTYAPEIFFDQEGSQTNGCVAAEQCIYLNNGGIYQTANFTSPVKEGTLTFRVAAMQKRNDDKINVSVSAGTINVTEVACKSKEWTDYTVIVSDMPAGAYIQFDGTGFLDEIKLISTAEVEKPKVTIGETGYATFCYGEPVVFPEAVKVYAAYIMTDGYVKLEELLNKDVPANSGVILVATPGEYELNYTGEITNATTEIMKLNDLKAATEDVTTTGIYIMAEVDGKVGFHPMESGKLEAGKAYLEANDVEGVIPAGARFIAIEGTDLPTGISSTMHYELGTMNCYDLQGRRVAQPAKGLYIVGGKKVVK